MTGWQWHQLNHMQIICTSLQTDNHESTSSLHIFYRPNALPAAQPTASKHWRNSLLLPNYQNNCRRYCHAMQQKTMQAMQQKWRYSCEIIRAACRGTLKSRSSSEAPCQARCPPHSCSPMSAQCRLWRDCITDTPLITQHYHSTTHSHINISLLAMC